MTDVTPAGSRFGFETFGTAVGLAVVTGALSVVAPSLTILAGTLAALAIAGWASLRRRVPGRGRRGGRSARWAALAAVTCAATVYLAPPEAVIPFRALVLGLGLVPLWLAERPAVRARCAVGGPI